MNPPVLRGGIIAAGDGRRLRESGFSLPKALVPVGGAPLIEWVIRNFLAVGITAPVIIVNEHARACVDWVRTRFPALDAQFIVKTTRSSLESFHEVSQRLKGGRALISTVDAWCRPADFVGFVDRGQRHPAEVSVLAATPFVADEAPLWLTVDRAGRVQTLGGSSGTLSRPDCTCSPNRRWPPRLRHSDGSVNSWPGSSTTAIRSTPRRFPPWWTSTTPRTWPSSKPWPASAHTHESPRRRAGSRPLLGCLP